MVWASQEPVDDSTPAIDSVRAKPLKKRCSSRAGLSRYYSSKSQSFSSLDLVQCTPFGTSAMALAKRPASFDLRRGGSPRPRLSHITTAFVHSGYDKEISMSIPNEDDGGKDSEQDVPDRCPCNDTIFSEPTEGFMSPEGSPNASSLQVSDSCGLSGRDIGSYQQQRQHQLTSEYLTHLSTLLPVQLPSPFSTNGGGAAAAGGGGSTRSCGLSSVLSGSSGCCVGKTLSSGSSSSSSVGGSSSCDSSMASTARLWQLASAHLATSYSAVLDRPDGHLTGGSGGAFSRAWPQYPGPGPISSLEAVTQTLLQSCGDDLKIIGVQSGCGRTVSGSGTGATYPLVSQTTAFGASSSAAGGGARPRNCRTSSGYLYPVLHNSGSAAMPAVALGSSAPTPMVTTPTSMVPATDPSHSNGSGSSANGAVPAPFGRKLGMGGIAHRRLRAAQAAGLVAVHSARHAAAGLWGSTEDMIASLTLSDKLLHQHQHQQQQQQHLLGSRPPAPSSVARVGDGTCWFASSGPRWQQAEHRPGESCPFGLGREVIQQPAGAAPGAAASAALSPVRT
ncbi:hypothetical protein Vafri_11924 [Volvox africanus]|uniref:Uncharacterized protein n=1 Tax=Volvox africanus TaxID=51714 RepID=A0A8J4F264_9CHLO|nr:hypothetical protein Vafri_11924 [Volvox africanus]